LAEELELRLQACLRSIAASAQELPPLFCEDALVDAGFKGKAGQVDKALLAASAAARLAANKLLSSDAASDGDTVKATRQGARMVNMLQCWVIVKGVGISGHVGGGAGCGGGGRECGRCWRASRAQRGLVFCGWVCGFARWWARAVADVWGWCGAAGRWVERGGVDVRWRMELNGEWLGAQRWRRFGGGAWAWCSCGRPCC